jgi:cellulase
MRYLSAAALISSLSYHVAAHGRVKSVTIGGQIYEGSEFIWPDSDRSIGFILPTAYHDANIICHKNASPASKAVPVIAGDIIALSWPDWPMTDPHPGVFLNYLAAGGTNNPTSIEKTKLKFFKISQFGYDPSVDINGPDKGLATGSFKKAGLVSRVHITSSLKSGIYVLRHEIIALHEAERPNGAQNYPQCITLQVNNGGTATPEGILGTELYKEDEPGVSRKHNDGCNRFNFCLDTG